MKRLLLLPFSFIYNFVMVNIGKTILFTLFGLSIYGVITEKQYEMEKLPVLSSIKNGGDYLYVINGKEPSVLIYKSPQKIKNNILLHQTETGTFTFYMVMCVVLGILAVVFIIASIVEDEAAWELSKVFQKSISILIHCELEDGMYHYTILGRLINIQKEKQYIGDESLAYRFDINDLTTIINLPKFKTKTEKRNKFLDKLGV